MEERNSILEDIKMEEIEASYFQRLITTLFDIVIEIGIIVAFYFLFPREPILVRSLASEFISARRERGNDV